MDHVRPPEADRTRRPRRIGILSPGTSEFDSRAQRIARSLVAEGDTVTIYSRRRPGLPGEETLDGYRIVRIPLDRADARAERSADRSGGVPGGSGAGQGTRTGGIRTRAWELLRGGYWTWHRWSDRVAVIHRFRNFPVRPDHLGSAVRGVRPCGTARHLAWHVGRVTPDAPPGPTPSWWRDAVRPTRRVPARPHLCIHAGLAAGHPDAYRASLGTCGGRGHPGQRAICRR